MCEGTHPSLLIFHLGVDFEALNPGGSAFLFCITYRVVLFCGVLVAPVCFTKPACWIAGCIGCESFLRAAESTSSKYSTPKWKEAACARWALPNLAETVQNTDSEVRKKAVLKFEVADLAMWIWFVWLKLLGSLNLRAFFKPCETRPWTTLENALSSHNDTRSTDLPCLWTSC